MSHLLEPVIKVQAPWSLPKGHPRATGFLSWGLVLGVSVSLVVPCLFLPWNNELSAFLSNLDVCTTPSLPSSPPAPPPVALPGGGNAPSPPSSPGGGNATAADFDLPGGDELFRAHQLFCTLIHDYAQFVSSSLPGLLKAQALFSILFSVFFTWALYNCAIKPGGCCEGCAECYGICIGLTGIGGLLQTIYFAYVLTLFSGGMKSLMKLFSKSQKYTGLVSSTSGVDDPLDSVTLEEIDAKLKSLIPYVSAMVVLCVLVNLWLIATAVAVVQVNRFRRENANYKPPDGVLVMR